MDCVSLFCPFCKGLQLADTVKVIKIDVDKNQGLANQYQVRGLPTLMVFKKGAMVWRQSGVVPAETLIQVLQDS
ncbi:MAG: thioredoxin domain-containing protein [Bacteroidota bacterium]